MAQKTPKLLKTIILVRDGDCWYAPDIGEGICRGIGYVFDIPADATVLWLHVGTVPDPEAVIIAMKESCQETETDGLILRRITEYEPTILDAPRGTPSLYDLPQQYQDLIGEWMEDYEAIYITCEHT